MIPQEMTSEEIQALISLIDSDSFRADLRKSSGVGELHSRMLAYPQIMKATQVVYYGKKDGVRDALSSHAQELLAALPEKLTESTPLDASIAACVFISREMVTTSCPLLWTRVVLRNNGHLIKCHCIDCGAEDDIGVSDGDVVRCLNEGPCEERRTALEKCCLEFPQEEERRRKDLSKLAAGCLKPRTHTDLLPVEFTRARALLASVLERQKKAIVARILFESWYARERIEARSPKDYEFVRPSARPEAIRLAVREGARSEALLRLQEDAAWTQAFAAWAQAGAVRFGFESPPSTILLSVEEIRWLDPQIDHSIPGLVRSEE